jgi:hypothetical protein
VVVHIRALPAVRRRYRLECSTSDLDVLAPETAHLSNRYCRDAAFQLDCELPRRSSCGLPQIDCVFRSTSDRTDMIRDDLEDVGEVFGRWLARQVP